ncbi:MAG: ATP-binding cassette domain-containing protein, partial [Methylobacteriaceae bacterium]|nr:ATP-binding cassette domain-containing protein [Methylobacteriaceae bacterium]
MVIDSATKFYQTKTGAVHALDKVSIDVREGEFLCIVGPSGCGKTTLLWSMAGLHGLSAGRVLLDGAGIRGPHRQVAMIFQDANLLPWRNLQKNIELPFELKRTRPDAGRIERLLARVGLAGFETKFPR